MTSERFTARVNEMLRRNETINEPDGWVQIQTSFYRELMAEAGKVEPLAEALKGCCERLCQACCRGVEHPDSHCGAADIRQLLKKAGL